MLWYIMTFTSLALLISFPLPLIILFPSCLLWGCLFNRHKSSTWASYGLPFKFIPLAKFCCPLGGIKIFGVTFGSVSSTFIFLTDGFKRGCSACKHAFKITGHSSGFLYPLLMLHLKAFLFASLFPLLPNFWS